MLLLFQFVSAEYVCSSDTIPAVGLVVYNLVQMSLLFLHFSCSLSSVKEHLPSSLVLCLAIVA